jgi:hypothetical protein
MALAALARHENRHTPIAPPDQKAVGQYVEAFSGIRGEKGLDVLNPEQICSSFGI